MDPIENNIRRNKRYLQDLLNNQNSPISKRPKLNHDELSVKDENLTLKQCQEILLQSIDIYLILHAEAENILQNLTDEQFVKVFNFNKVMVRCLLMELHQRTFYQPDLDDIPSGMPFDLSVLVTLSFMVNGHFECIADLGYFRKCTATLMKKCVQHVCQTIVYFLSPDYVCFPCSSTDQQYNKTKFLQQFGVPGVVGVIDYFHVPIAEVKPQDEHAYIDRRYQQSVTVQVISDQNYRFLDVNPRFSGNTHNLHIWRRSHIRDMLQHSQEKDPRTWLVADRSYHLTTGIMNPYRNAFHKQQKDVNKALKEVHEVLLRAYSILKARFRCLNISLPFNHAISANIITSCVTLHNYLIAKHEDVENELSYDLPTKQKLPNAHHEDRYSQVATANREFVKDFIYNNSL